MHLSIGLSVLLILQLGLIPIVIADPGDRCFEQMNGQMCGLLDSPFDAMLEAYDPVFGDLTIAILWGILISVLWMKVQNTALVGIVGLIIAGAITGLSPEAYRIGIMLAVVAMGMMMFQLIQQRIKYPQ